MMLAKIIFLAMPFMGIRLGIPMVSGKGTGNVAPAFTPSLNFSDARNSQYIAMGMI